MRRLVAGLLFVTEHGGATMNIVTIEATDGANLRGNVYEPEGEPAYQLLVFPGIGVPQRVFRHIARWFAGNGVRVVTFDYRGMGASKLDQFALQTASLTTWATRDAVGALRFVEQSSKAPVVLLGHSFGGQALGFSDEFRRLQGAILVGSQFGLARHWDGLARVKIAAYWNLILPASAAVYEVVPGWTGLGERLPRGVAREWARWGRTREWLLPHVEGAERRYATFDRPIRAYAMTDDDIAPPRGVSDLLGRFRAAEVERVDLAPSDLSLPKIGHIGLFRPGAPERIWKEMFDFGCRVAGCVPSLERAG
jgi:predicted alpha/beta hydrolase